MTENQSTMQDVLKAFSKAALQNYGSFAYEAGYLESLVVNMLPFVPKSEQKGIIEDLIRATQKVTQEVTSLEF